MSHGRARLAFASRITGTAGACPSIAIVIAT
jgi:hypothetical protein